MITSLDPSNNRYTFFDVQLVKPRLNSHYCVPAYKNKIVRECNADPQPTVSTNQSVHFGSTFFDVLAVSLGS